jgi:hypothetical protein
MVNRREWTQPLIGLDLAAIETCGIVIGFAQEARFYKAAKAESTQASKI